LSLRMIFRNHCKLPRQYRFPISVRSFAYLKSEREMIDMFVLKGMIFIWLSWVRAKAFAALDTGCMFCRS